ncbi:hypothetical protein J6590_004798 [Homalodisca vitripennis]|nr:hypothetical protein J6590_004798 [Homalodisca vitripennis]
MPSTPVGVAINRTPGGRPWRSKSSEETPSHFICMIVTLFMRGFAGRLRASAEDSRTLWATRSVRLSSWNNGGLQFQADAGGSSSSTPVTPTAGEGCP